MKHWLSIIATLFLFGAALVAENAELSDLKARAEKGDAEAQFNLGERYHDGQGIEQDYAEAFKWARKAAEQGYAPALNAVGKMYYNGKGVTQDYPDAFKLFRKAAEQGHAVAQINLGLMVSI